MKVTITIEDDGEGGLNWGGAAEPADVRETHVRGPHVRGPHVRGPNIVLPRDDGTETEIDIDALMAAVEQAKPAG